MLTSYICGVWSEVESKVWSQSRQRSLSQYERYKYFQLKTAESSVEVELTSDIFGWCLILSEVESKVWSQARQSLKTWESCRSRETIIREWVGRETWTLFGNTFELSPMPCYQLFMKRLPHRRSYFTNPAYWSLANSTLISQPWPIWLIRPPRPSLGGEGQSEPFIQSVIIFVHAKWKLHINGNL